MSCHLLLNLLHELANMILCEALPSIISFLPTNVINLVINDNEFEIFIYYITVKTIGISIFQL